MKCLLIKDQDRGRHGCGFLFSYSFFQNLTDEKFNNMPFLFFINKLVVEPHFLTLVTRRRLRTSFQCEFRFIVQIVHFSS